jgi:hypothetical protein
MGEYCPFDGWSSAASRELTEAVAQLSRFGKNLTIEELRKAGVGTATLKRTIIVEFGASASAFEALAPEEYVVNGAAKPLVKLDLNFK